jgi:dTDP-4-amino-4,6-dideoxygalactose transaminase
MRHDALLIPADRDRSERVRDSFLVFGSPYIGEEEIAEVVATLRSGWVGTGPRVAQLEEEFAAYIGATSCCAVNSCTAALHLSLLAAGLEPGDEVITTPLTFCATVNAIIHAGATPVLADVDPITWNIDPRQIEARITTRTRAIVPVHFAGRACDMGAICSIAERHGLDLIEDCAHAIETTYEGKHAGTFGRLGCFSFYVTKNLMTGEGGMIATTSPHDDLARIKTLALHGMSKDAWKRFSDKGFKHYRVVECGFKYNMMDLQAAIGIHQLRRIEANWLVRKKIWERYNAAFADLDIGIPAPLPPSDRHALHLYTITIDPDKTGMTRDAFLDEMTRRKIGVGVHYVSLPEHPYYQGVFGWRAEDYPISKRIGETTVSLPLSAKLSEADVEDVIWHVNHALRVNRPATRYRVAS